MKFVGGSEVWKWSAGYGKIPGKGRIAMHII